MKRRCMARSLPVGSAPGRGRRAVGGSPWRRALRPADAWTVRLAGSVRPSCPQPRVGTDLSRLVTSSENESGRCDGILALMAYGPGCVPVVRGGVEPPTPRFSVPRSARDGANWGKRRQLLDVDLSEGGHEWSRVVTPGGSMAGIHAGQPEPAPSRAPEGSGQRRILGSCVGSAYIAGHPWSMASGRSS